MPRPQSIADSLAKLLDESDRPIYVVDPQRRIVYCNPALAEWIDLERKRIIGRRVEFHSEEPTSDDARHSDVSPLTDLCPPPSALAGEIGRGTISCVARDGRTLHRRAEFVPLGRVTVSRKSHSSQEAPKYSALVTLDTENLSVEELAKEVSSEPTTDELHRTIRGFRRGQAKRYSIQSLLGVGPATQKLRLQVEAAATSNANTLIHGRRGSGRKHVALAIFYRSQGGEGANLLPLDCKLLTESLVARTLARFRDSHAVDHSKVTLLLENLECLPLEYHPLLLAAIQEKAPAGRVIGTIDSSRRVEVEQEEHTATNVAEPPAATKTGGESQNLLPKIDAALIDAISTISIRIPKLVDRLEDLPILSQFFLEAANRSSDKQVGSIRSDALDLLALYSWPGELDQLRETIATAHAASSSHEITATDLPPIIHHAYQAAAHMRQSTEPIVLDDLLASIEMEAITRALAQSGGNKSEAAALLGMTRPRLYRRLIQLGFIVPETDAATDNETPEFIEHDGAE
ncbi:MAG TPA: helix-turn-helix domain-containing protein [Lacipirellulaceae bacterium]|nr:helix-turn-helix domain-containing protein [Lacipirellulaceae bacterium]